MDGAEEDRERKQRMAARGVDEDAFFAAQRNAASAKSHKRKRSGDDGVQEVIDLTKSPLRRPEDEECPRQLAQETNAPPNLAEEKDIPSTEKEASQPEKKKRRVTSSNMLGAEERERNSQDKTARRRSRRARNRHGTV